VNRQLIIRTLIPIFILSLLFGIPGMSAQGVKAAPAETAFQYLPGWNLIPVAPPNNKPVITESSPQLVTMSEDSLPTPFSLTLHATDADGDILTWSIATPALYGTASASGTGYSVEVRYTPNANYYGSDSFVVQVSDGKFKDTLTVNVTIQPVNDAPVITGQNLLSTPQNTPLTITLADLLVTDVDNTYPTGFLLNVLAGADYTLDGNTITPALDFIGTLTVPVKVNDGLADSNIYDLSVDVARPSRIYYVDNTDIACSNSGEGTLIAPFCTINRGATLAVAGDSVHVLNGTYAETVQPTNSGAAGRPITFTADPDVTVTGDPNFSAGSSGFAVGNKSYVTIDGFNIYHTIDKGIYVENSDHITITNNHISYAGAETSSTTHQQGIVLRGTTYSTVTGNVTDHNSCIGIRLINGSDYNTVSNNLSFANASVIAYPVVEVSDAAGIELTGSSYNIVINNLTFGNEDSGINLYVNSTNVGSSYNLVIGNLSYGNGDHGIDNNNSPYNTIVGNTVHGNGTTGINSVRFLWRQPAGGCAVDRGHNPGLRSLQPGERQCPDHLE
jgi:parallel beta-helix repeat protein/VCBS repeat-containing protein